jgi:hypothetical protein
MAGKTGRNAVCNLTDERQLWAESVDQTPIISASAFCAAARPLGALAHKCCKAVE